MKAFKTFSTLGVINSDGKEMHISACYDFDINMYSITAIDEDGVIYEDKNINTKYEDKIIDLLYLVASKYRTCGTWIVESNTQEWEINPEYLAMCN